MKFKIAKALLENSGYFVEAKMSLKDKLNNAKQFNKNKDEILLIKIAKENGYKLIGKVKDDDGSNRFIFEKKYRGETISFNASLYYEKNDCQINYDFDYESGNDYFDETWGDCLKTYEDEAIREIDEEIEESEWDDEELDEDFTQGVGAPLGADQGIPHSMQGCAVPMMRLGDPAPRGRIQKIPGPPPPHRRFRPIPFMPVVGVIPMTKKKKKKRKKKK